MKNRKLTTLTAKIATPLLIVFFAACASDPEGGSSSPGVDGGITTTTTSTYESGDPTTTMNGGGGGDCPQPSLPANYDDVMADFEDGTGGVNQTAPGRGGGFYAFNDGSGTQVPEMNLPGAPDATPVNRCSASIYALCTSGSGFSEWGAGIGTDVGQIDASGNKAPYDASQYSGVAFWAKSNAGPLGGLKVKFPDRNTAEEGGLCDPNEPSGATACYDDFHKLIGLTSEWQSFTILFSELIQGGWGRKSDAFDVTTLYSLQFQVDQGQDFDFCIDDIIFIR